MRKDREGTVREAWESAGVMKKRSGIVIVPVLRAWTVAVAMFEVCDEERGLVYVLVYWYQGVLWW